MAITNRKHVVDLNDENTYVTSKIDGRKMGRITHTYLKKYNMTIDEYCIKYGLDKTKDLVAKSLNDRFKWTKKRAIELYGESEGVRKWDEYREKQAITNTFDYKNSKYGMSKDEFDAYNLNRACTKENLIKRHGTEHGTEKWEKYCIRQAHAGCSLKYFTELYGEVDGEVIYKDLCKRKAQSIDNFIGRYGTIEGVKRYVAYHMDRESFYSNISQKLFDEIVKHSTSNIDKIYYATKNSEYGVYSSVDRVMFFYDYVDIEKGKCIEFNGDVFHANPDKFEECDYPNPFVKNLTSKKIWEKDEKKIKALKTYRNIETLVVWESEYLKTPEIVLSSCLEFLGYV